ncbi:DNRLRE domain-containing protein [Streptosporangium sp. NPDC023825]|uniref:DNRLRE domain-containing protein n=1 Tax=Streptosporangium sp. NPDC023825 TaxID=3154909 RepID=UPI00342A62AC
MTSPQQAEQAKEIPAGASETRRITRQSDGRVTMEIWSRPVRVKQDATWAWIDTTLIEKDGALQPKVAKHRVVFSAGGAEKPLVTLSLDAQRSLSLSWPKPLPKPTVKGTLATYADAVAPGADLVVSALPEGFRYDIIYRSRPAKLATITLPVQVKGLALRKDAHGRLQVTGTDGEHVAVASAAAIQPKQPTAAARVELEGSGHTQHMVITPDKNLPTSASGPLTVAAAVITGNVVDADVANDGLPADPTWPFLTAGSLFGTLYRTYIRFDDEIFTHGDVPILNAKLSALNIDGPNCGAVVGAGIQARRVTSGWDPTNLTWANKPATSAEGATTVTRGYSAGCGEGVLEWPVAEMVRAWLGGAPYHGVELRGANESNSNDNWRLLASAEYSTAETAPKLTIEFDGNAIPSSLSAAVVGDSLNPEEMAGQDFTYQSLYGRTGFGKEDLDELARTGSLSETGFPKPGWPEGEEWPFPEDPNADPPYWRPQPGEPTDVAKAPSQSSPGMSATADDRDTVLATWSERDGKKVYYRKGFYDINRDDGFGDTKIRLKHNLNQRAVVSATKNPIPGQQGKTQQFRNPMRWDYLAVFHLNSCEGFWFFQNCKIHDTMNVQVVVDYTRKGAPTADATIGVITAFCIKSNWCDDWVKTVIN